MLTLVALWTALLLLFAGVGRGVLFGIAGSRPQRRWILVDLWDQAWLGVGVACGLLGIASLITPMGWLSFVGIAFVSVLGWLVTSRQFVRALVRRVRRPSARVIAKVGMMLSVALFIGKGANAPVIWWDTLSTHIQQVKWMVEFPAVPGLANFSPKLGFDQLHFLVAASLEWGPFRDKTVHILNGFFATLFAWQWIDTLLTRDVVPTQKRTRLYSVLLIPFFLHKVQFERELASFAGDLVVAVAAASLGKLLVQLPGTVGNRGQTRQRYEQQLLVAATLATFLLAAKLNGAIFFLLGLWLIWRNQRQLVWASSSRTLLVLLAPSALILSAFFLRRAVLTGWLLFPVPIGNLHLPWTVPVEEARYQQCWIQSWSRLPHVDCHDVMERGFLRWFVPWFHGFSRWFKEWRLFVGTLLLCCGVLLTRRYRGQTEGEKALLVSSVASLALWFWGAPDWRFAVAFFWMFFAWAMLRALHPIIHLRRATLIALVLALGLSYEWKLLVPTWGSPSWVDLGPEVQLPFKKVTLTTPDRSPLEIYVPDGFDRCGNAPVPCTPYPAGQRLRMDGQLRHGFLPARSNSLADHAVEDPLPPGAPRSVEVDIESPIGSDGATWYWDPRGAFSEERRSTQLYSGRTVVRWSLPAEAQTHRLDPGSQPGRYRIHGLSMQCDARNEGKLVLKGEELRKRIVASNDVAISIDANIVVLDSRSQDPFVVLDLPRCEQRLSDDYGWLWGLGLTIAAVVSGVLVGRRASRGK